MQAAVVAKTAAKSFVEIQNTVEDSESPKAEKVEESFIEENEDDDKLRKSTLDKLEKASEDSLLGQASHKKFRYKD